VARLYAGTGRTDITPPVGTALCGSLGPRYAEGIDTPLMAHALVLDNGATRLAFIALDLIALLGREVNEAKHRIQQETGIPPENVLVACSHTHAGPYVAGLLDGDRVRPDEAYLARVVRAIVAAVAQAAEGLAPAEVGWAATRVPGLGENRRRLRAPDDAINAWLLPVGERDKCPPAGPVDDELGLLAVRRTTGSPLALVWSYALHAHCFTWRNVSADFPYHVWQRLIHALRGDFTSIFLAGACGDINRPGSVTPQMVVDRLAVALAELYNQVNWTTSAVLRARESQVEVPLRDFSVFQEEEIRRKWPSGLEYFRAEWQHLRRLGERSLRTVVQALVIGEFAVAAVPGEYFVALGLDVKRRSPFAVTAVAELANDYVGYIPTAAAYEQGGYELFNARSSKVARGTGEMMADELVRLLNQLATQGRPQAT